MCWNQPFYVTSSFWKANRCESWWTYSYPHWRPRWINSVLLKNSFEKAVQWRDAMKSERRGSFQRGWKVKFVCWEYICLICNFQARLSSRKSARWFQRRIVPVGGKQLPFQDQLDTETQVWTLSTTRKVFLFRLPSATTQSKVQNTLCSTSSSSTCLLSSEE